MFGLVKACFWCVSDVDARINVIVDDGTDERDSPFRRIESHDCDGSALANLKLLARLSKPESILIILIPGPALFSAIALDPHRHAIFATTDSVLE